MGSERVKRRLAAVLASDVVGYSRLMAADEAGTLSRLTEFRRELTDPAIAEHGGRTVKLMGDGALVEFASVVDAVECALAIQRSAADVRPDDGEAPITLRIGIHLGDVIIEGDDIYGDGVNIAARLEGVALPGGIALSDDAFRQVQGKVHVEFTDIGEQKLKNIERAVRVHRADLAPAPVPNGTSAPVAPDKPSIAVLPFENMSGDGEQDFFADGMAEDIITALSKLRWFFVIARNSTFAYKGRSPGIRDVTRDLGVRYVLEGSVRRAGNRVRIPAQLVDGHSGNQIWGERYDRELDDIFAVQDDITRNVVTAIEPRLHAAEQGRIQSTPPESLDAWGCVIRSLWHLGRFTREDTDRASALLRQAIATSPEYAKAHSLLAFAEARRVFFGAEMNAAIVASRDIARTARTLDDDDPWSHFASGYVECFTGRYDEAIAWYRRAIELNENFALAHGNMAAALSFGGYPDEAVEAVERALRMSPWDPFNFAYLHFAGVAYFAAERYAEGVVYEQRALQERPDFAAALRFLAACHAALGELDRARDAVSEALRIEPGSSIRKDAYGQVVYARAEDRERYADLLRKAGLPEG